MLALFVKLPRSDDVAYTKDPQFFADFKYSADHGLLLRFPHFSIGHV